MRARLALVIAFMGCGRVAFDPTSSVVGDGRVGDGTGEGTSDTPADLCAAGDGVCRVSCLTSDPDCATTCGDGVCVGNAGELCTNCTECNTRSVVCGNGQCDPGEDSDVCYADCGPTPWQWTALETDFMTRINAERVAGITCPTMGTQSAAALTTASNLTAGAREWAWESRYALNSGGISCNGRNGNDRCIAAGCSGTFSDWFISGTDPQNALDNFKANSAICPELRNTAYTSAGIGIVDYNGAAIYVLFLD